MLVKYTGLVFSSLLNPNLSVASCCCAFKQFEVGDLVHTWLL